MDIETLITTDPYGMSQPQKELILTQQLNELVQYHYQHCPKYAYILRLLYQDCTHYSNTHAIPFLPVNIFKTIQLTSISKQEIFKTLASSGTTGNAPSLITLDSATSRRQTTALATIMQTYLGIKRLPMLIIDSSSVLKDPKHFSARGAGIVGMTQFGCDPFYAFDDQMKINRDALKEWMNKHKGNTIFIFGFTYILWQYFFKETTPGEFDFSNAVLFHGGGWKKLKDISKDNAAFKIELKNHFNLRRCHSFYGMVEQTGSIFVECEEGHLHCPSFADVIIRDPKSWQPSKEGQTGVIQALSLLPTSYPGHSLLTEDLGYIKGIDTCPCGRKGKFFWVEGRVPQAEPRGCGDTFAIHAGPPTTIPEDDNETIPPELYDLRNSPMLSCEHQPFDSTLLEFCQRFSKKLSAHSDPDLAALGFWFRPAQLNALKSRFEKQNMPTIIRSPRGLVFHITASNVDTLFAYSWMISLLTGNNNIVRLPSKHSFAIEQILNIIKELFQNKDYASIARTNHFIRYGHQKYITETISALADIRIIWGGNETINTIRNIDLNPYAKEIVFPNRTSYAIISSEGYGKFKNDQKAHLAQAFFRDVYGFDQHACSSPQFIFWIGDDKDIQITSTEFYHFLEDEIQRRSYQVPLSEFLQKQTAIYTLCAQFPVASAKTISNELSILSMHEPPSNTIQHPGAGLFYHIELPSLQDINPYLSSHDQTLTYFGIEAPLLDIFAKSLKGRGPTRIVPIGEALNFSFVWDGYDLLQELTRCIEIH